MRADDPLLRKGFRLGKIKPSTRKKPPLRWTGIVFALASNLLLVTVADHVVRLLNLYPQAEIVAAMVAPLSAGALTALYTKERGGMHAFLGGLFSLPLLILYIFPGLWQLAAFAAAFCSLGGVLTEILVRRNVPVR